MRLDNALGTSSTPHRPKRLKCIWPPRRMGPGGLSYESVDTTIILAKVSYTLRF